MFEEVSFDVKKINKATQVDAKIAIGCGCGGVCIGFGCVG